VDSATNAHWAALHSCVAGRDEQITPVPPGQRDRVMEAVKVTRRQHERGGLNSVSHADYAPSRQVSSETLKHNLRSGSVGAAAVGRSSRSLSLTSRRESSPNRQAGARV
jgi:hypothetical protein